MSVFTVWILGIKELVQEIKEQKYASKIKSIYNFNFLILLFYNIEPLGKTLDRKYEFPNQTQQQSFKYGVPTKFSYTNFEIFKY